MAAQRAVNGDVVVRSGPNEMKLQRCRTPEKCSRIDDGDPKGFKDFTLLQEEVLLVQRNQGIDAGIYGCGNDWRILQFDVKFGPGYLVNCRIDKYEAGKVEDGFQVRHHMRRLPSHISPHFFEHVVTDEASTHTRRDEIEQSPRGPTVRYRRRDDDASIKKDLDRGSRQRRIVGHDSCGRSGSRP